MKFNNFTIDEEKFIIYNLDIGKSYNTLISDIITDGTINILDKKDQIVDRNSLVKTGDVISFKYNVYDEEYKISVLGDVTGTGDLNIGDVAKLYSSVKGKFDLNGEFKLAGDVTLNREIDLGDVSKLYSYLRNKIPSLN